jgi:hypothetical protein
VARIISEDLSIPDTVDDVPSITDELEQQFLEAEESRQRAEILSQGVEEYFCDLAFAVSNIDTDIFDSPVVTVGDVALFSPPDVEPFCEASITSSFPGGPTEPSLGVVSDVILPEPPVLVASRPSMSNIPVPDPLDVVLPADPTLVDVAVVSTPDFILPDVPTIESLTIPDAPAINLPAFSESVRELPDLPSVEIAWNEMAYSSTLLTTVINELVDSIANNTTGVDSIVEAGVWERNRVRQEEMFSLLTNKVREIAASRGIQVPDAVINQYAVIEHQKLLTMRSSQTRDVLIEIERLKQTNFRTSTETALRFEQSRITLHSQEQARLLKSKKAALDLVVRLFNAEVDLYDADARAFEAKVTLFKALVAVELSRLDIFKAELESQRAVAQLNTSKVQLYNAQIQGIRTKVDVFKSQVEAAKSISAVNELRVQTFANQISGFEAKVDANALEFSAYASRVSAEANKLRAYKSDVRAFKSEVSAYKTVVDAELKVHESDVLQNQTFPLDLLKTRTDVFKSLVDAEASRISVDVSTIAAKVDCYKAKTGVVSGHNGIAVEVARAKAQSATSRAALSSQSALAAARTQVSRATIEEANIRFSGQIEGQLAAARISATTFSANRSTTQAESITDATSISTNSSKNTDNRTVSTLNKSTKDTHIFSDKL